MTARQYNFTKQNNVVMKARRRFTKQNGVVKQILNGWTKTNGVVEQVYQSQLPSSFASVAPLLSNTGNLLYIDMHYLLAKDSSSSIGLVRIQEDYLSSGNATQIAFGSPNNYGFNYAGGVVADQSLVSVSGNQYQEVLTNDVYNPIQYFNYNLSGVRSVIKIGNGQYAGMKTISGTTGWYLYNFSPTGESQIRLFTNSSWDIQRFGLTLYDGRGVFLSRDNSTSTKYVWLTDYDNTDPMLFSSIVVVSDNSNLSVSTIYTPNGQDCIFSIKKSTNGAYFKLCKYNIQTKSVVVGTDLGNQSRRCLLGTYNGYIYVLYNSGAQDVLAVVEKYDLSLSLVDTHTISLSNAQATISSINSQTIHSGGKYAAVSYTDSNSVEELLVLDLSLF